MEDKYFIEIDKNSLWKMYIQNKADFAFNVNNIKFNSNSILDVFQDILLDDKRDKFCME